MNKRDQKSAKRNEYGASKQVDGCVEAGNTYRSCLCLQEREPHKHVDQVEYHKEHTVADQVVEKVEQGRSLTLFIGLQGG